MEPVAALKRRRKLRRLIPTSRASSSIESARLKLACRYSSTWRIFWSECGRETGRIE
jgi:hypothetical protein